MTSDPVVLGFLLGLGMAVALALVAGLVLLTYLAAQRLLERWRATRFERAVDRLEERQAVDEAERLLGLPR